MSRLPTVVTNGVPPVKPLTFVPRVSHNTVYPPFWTVTGPV